ncbi:hypothetical protein BDY24DRAFT_371040 [Mrakia frigida]|uniref:uncharacterized protein n=1 Tax=Mrakia frigida TaxID=29902 RepID=UPI003FCC1FBD
MQQINFDAPTLIAAQATLSLVLAAFKSPRYNFELFVFGIIAHELPNSPLPYRLFGAFLGLSIPLDFIWLLHSSHRQGWIIFLLTLVNLLFKIPTFFSTIASLKERGDDSFSSLPSINVSSRGVWLAPSSGGINSASHQSSNANGEPIFQMPGGDQDFNSSPVQQQQAPPPPPPSRAQQQSGQAGEGRYQAI